MLRYCDRTRFQPVVVVSGELGHWQQPIEDLDIEVHLLRGSRLAKARQLRRICARPAADVLFSWSAYTNPYAAAVLDVGCRRIGSFRNNPPRAEGGWAKVRHALQTASLHTVVANSPELHQALSKMAPRRQLVVFIPNGVEPIEQPTAHRRRWRARLGISDEEHLVLGVGRIVAQKNFTRFVDVVEALGRELPCRGVLAGPKGEELTAVLQRIDGMKDGDVRYLGPVEDARELVCAADVFLMTSDFEGMPNVIMEAMAAGTPCVTTPVSGVRELIPTQEYGIVAGFDTESLVEGVRQILTDVNRADRIGDASKRRIGAQFSAEESALRLWDTCS